MRTLAFSMLLLSSAIASPLWRTTAGVDIHWDNNVGDNITHVSETWGVPYGSLLFKQPLNRSQELSIQGDFQYENEFSKRSPTLNAPLDQYVMRFSQDFSKTFSASTFGKAARTFDPDFRLVKLQGRLGAGVSWSPSVWKVDLSAMHDWEDYGDHSQDGNTRWYNFDLRYNILKTLQLGWGYTIEDRQSYSSSYTYFDQSIDAKIKYNIPKGASFSLNCSRSYKMYSSSKRNHEWQGSMAVSIPFGNLRAREDYSGKSIHSNTPGYSWSEKSSTTSLEWSMDNKNSKKKKRR